MNKSKIIDFKKIAIASLLLMISVSAQAFKVNLDGSGTNATSILNLDIGGTFYDITFEESLVTAVAPCPGDGGTYPCDLYAAAEDVAGATAAAAQIALALNQDVSIGGDGEPVATTVGPAGMPGGGQVLVPYRFDTNACNGGVGGTRGTCAQNAYPPIGEAGTWRGFGLIEVNEGSDGMSVVNYTRFAPAAAVVPVPPAVWLFGSALGLLGWVRRRVNHAAVANVTDSHMG